MIKLQCLVQDHDTRIYDCFAPICKAERESIARRSECMVMNEFIALGGRHRGFLGHVSIALGIKERGWA